MIRAWFFSGLWCAAAAVSAAEPNVPATPAGRVFGEWLVSLNTADPAKLKAFKDTYKRETTVEEYLALQQETGGYSLLRIEKNEPLEIGVLLKEKESDAAARMAITVREGTPAEIVNVQFEPVSLPPDLAPARMPMPQALKALTARVDDLAKAGKFSGVMLVAQGDQVLYRKSWGMADRDAKRAVDPTIQFDLASQGKMFTAIAALQLIEAGKMSLDDTVGKHLTDYPNTAIARKVTVRHLLTHAGGTGDIDIFGPEAAGNRARIKEQGDYVAAFGARDPVHEPGAEYQYSNYGYVLLGALIEKVSGLSYYDYIQQHVFAPAGMASSGFPLKTEASARYAIGYTWQNGQWVPNTALLPYRGMAAGGGYATADDLLRFARALQAGKLVSKALLAEATRQHNPWYGLGFMVRGEASLRFFGHSGGAEGMSTEFRVYPALDTVVIVLANLDPPAAHRPVDFLEARMPTRS
ncbi:serine hydrolase domain-containing protein [Tahibacter amnicola]|uniref:Beta-lactamase family protein n=1 Tax=Tahibacter amnicola TaxID=2976241 RepID=A0ABY6B8E7_9GAMM|nr:serine hydrolase domain-containing protein [Tahibacter amnicola]UXI66289.1 beta-lactamase family protein [Tahibacter amnicola]